MNTFVPRQMTSKHPPVHLACMLSNPLSRQRSLLRLWFRNLSAGQHFARMGQLAHHYLGSLRSIIVANRMSKLPSLPSRNSIYVRIFRFVSSLYLEPLTAAPIWERCSTSSQIFLSTIPGDRRVSGAASSFCWSVVHLRNVVIPSSILKALG